ncbi:nucleotidyltransferase domain-containing protein [Pseudomonas fluorescens]|uniref:nucleotidyltransferase domain-containing protein n=1 Tax=Pseudomonas fluorescens TaxID=294 RepID=UPI0011313EF5|nr:nucleotidyltransferase domain-containing protein [Pseudomonas fluorescens]TMU78600.1 nucleotidyltransferase domain-containing protein [Pseudomonas fluorescens]
MTSMTAKNETRPSTEEIEFVAAEVARFFLDKKQPLFSFLSGSVAEGIATPNSDYDVYAVFDTCEESEALVIDNDRPIEITSITLAKLENTLLFVQRGEDLASVTNYELLLCHRVYSGIGLTTTERFHELQTRFDIETFRANLTEMCFLNAERSLKVCNGFIMTGDKRSASLSANNALKHSFNMLLAMKGATSILEKWQMRYATRLLGDEHLAFTHYIELISHVPCQHTRQIDSYIQDVKNLHQLICDNRILQKHIEDEAFFTPSRLFTTNTRYVASTVFKDRLGRVVNSHSRFYLIMDGTPVLELPEAAAVLWALIDNQQTTTDLAFQARELLGLPFDSTFEFLTSFGNAKAINIVSHDFDFLLAPQ